MSYYTLVQYFPGLLDEAINIAAIALDDDIALVAITSNWDRVEAFSGHPTQTIRKALSEYLTSLTPESTKTHIKNTNSYPVVIRFTPLRGSLQTPEELLKDIAAIALSEPILFPDSVPQISSQ